MRPIGHAVLNDAGHTGAARCVSQAVQVGIIQYGMMGIQFPKQYGGSGGDYICYSIVIEECSKFCGTTGCIIACAGSGRRMPCITRRTT